MKRFHVHVAVRDLQQSVRFYSSMFGREPSVLKPDYAKWMLDDPRVNFAISHRGQRTGVDHLGLQAETDEELEGIRGHLVQAAETVVAEKGVHCCYAHSDKYWVTDPQGIAWESFRSLSSVPLYGADSKSQPSSCGASGAGDSTSCGASTTTAPGATGATTCCASDATTPGATDASTCCASDATTPGATGSEARCCVAA